jgi:uncharacterized protein (DUF362 family)
MAIYAAKISPQASARTVKDVLSRHLDLLCTGTASLKNKKVLVLPNLCGPGSLPHEYSMTSRDMILACVQTAREAGAASVAVANHAADYVRDTRAFYDALGIFDLARKEGFDFHNLRRESFSQDGESRLAGILDFTDVVLNVTLPKTHHQADGVSLSLKNLGMGLTAGRERHMHQRDLSAAIVAANITVRQRVSVLDIIDGRRGQQGMGPHFGEPIEPGFMLFGNDPVGVDATAARLMGFDPFLIRTLTLARHAGLGSLEPEVRGEIIQPLYFKRSPNWSFSTLPDGRAVVFRLKNEGNGYLTTYQLNTAAQRYERLKEQLVSFSPDTTVQEAENFIFDPARLETILSARDVLAANNNLIFTPLAGFSSHPKHSRGSLPNRAISDLGSWLEHEKLARSDDLEIRVSSSAGGAIFLVCDQPAEAGTYRGARETAIPGSQALARFLDENGIRSFLVRRGTDHFRFVESLVAEFSA